MRYVGWEGRQEGRLADKERYGLWKKEVGQLPGPGCQGMKEERKEIDICSLGNKQADRQTGKEGRKV